jgi:hypothetical protein
VLYRLLCFMNYTHAAIAVVCVLPLAADFTARTFLLPCHPSSKVLTKFETYRVTSVLQTFEESFESLP